jgi:hypothetical protein
MDYKEYKKTYEKLLSEKGLVDFENTLGEKEKVLKQINDFLGKYPKILPKDKLPSTPIFELSLKELYKRTLQTAIDIINDVSNILSMRGNISNETLRRQLFKAFTLPERRLYVGIWLLLVAFILYFIDSST